MKKTFSLFRIIKVIFLFAFAVCASCSKGSDPVLPGDDDDDNEEPAPPALAPGWYIDSLSFRTTGTFVTYIGLQKSGKIVAVNTHQLARFNKDGSLDASFAPYSVTEGEIHALLVDKNDQIWVGGNFENFAGSGYSYLVRLKADGTIDGGMTDQEISNISSQKPDVRCLALQSTGKLLVGGGFRCYVPSGTPDASGTYDDLIRLHPDGRLDLDFVRANGDRSISYGHRITHINVLPGDKIYVTGSVVDVNEGKDIVRLFPDGSLDNDFKKTAGSFSSTNDKFGFPLVSASLPDGTVLMGATESSSTGMLLQLSNKGAVNKKVLSLLVNRICQFADDEIFLASVNPSTTYFGGINGKLSIINKAGTDPGTLKTTIARDVYDVIKESDSTILVAGNLIIQGSVAEKGLIRLKKVK